MKKLQFKKDINASAEKVYNTMLGIDTIDTYQQWTAEFNPTSTYEGSWEKGSKIYFVGTNENGKKGGMTQADKYFETFFEYFDIIAQSPFSFEAVDHIKKGYRRCACRVDSIYFKITENNVEIMAIVGQQDLNQKL